jgi:hypothetical protein
MFVVQATGVNIKNRFILRREAQKKNKLECLSLGIIFSLVSSKASSASAFTFQVLPVG